MTVIRRQGRGTARAHMARRLGALAVVLAAVAASTGGGTAYGAVTRVEVENLTASNWSIDTWTGYSNGHGLGTSTVGAPLTYTFTVPAGETWTLSVGSYITACCAVNWTWSVDGGTTATSSNTGGGSTVGVVITTGALAAGSHTFSIQLPSGRPAQYLDYFDLTSTVVPTTSTVATTTTVPPTTTTVPPTTTTVPPTTTTVATTTTVPATTTTTTVPLRMVLLSGEQSGVFWLLAAAASFAFGVAFFRFLWGRDYR